MFRPIKNAVLEAANAMPLEMILAMRTEFTEPVSMSELEEILSRIEQEHRMDFDMMPVASFKESAPWVREVESFLYRISKVFEDKRPIGEQGQVLDRKEYVREVEREREMGMQ